METFLLIISVLLIAIVLLQSGKAEGASKVITGGADLFKNRKERGSELVISRVTFVLGFAFFIICLVMTLI